MTDLISIDDTPQRQIAGQVYQLDESIIDRLPKRNTKQGLAANTKQTYLSAIRDYNRFLASNGLHVSQESLKLYFDEIKGKLKASTLNLKRSALLKCIKALMGEDSVLKQMAIERAFQQVDSYKLDKTISTDECLKEDEVRDIMKAAQSEKTRLIVLFLYKTACRVSELCSIRLTDCKSINGHIKMRVIGKGNKERDVYAPTALYDAVRREYQGATWLFESKTGKPLHPDNVANQIRKAGRIARLGNVTPHMLRHGRATDLLLRKGQSLKAVSKYLGHHSVSTTAGMYIHDAVDVNEIFAMDSI